MRTTCFSWNLKQFMHKDCTSIRICSHSSKKKRETKTGCECAGHGLVAMVAGGAAAWRGSSDSWMTAGWWRRAVAASVLPEIELWAAAVLLGCFPCGCCLFEIFFLFFYFFIFFFGNALKIVSLKLVKFN